MINSWQCRRVLAWHKSRKLWVLLLIFFAFEGLPLAAQEQAFLSDRPELIDSARQGWGTFGFDQTAHGQPLESGRRSMGR